MYESTIVGMAVDEEADMQHTRIALTAGWICASVLVFSCLLMKPVIELCFP